MLSLWNSGSLLDLQRPFALLEQMRREMEQGWGGFDRFGAGMPQMDLIEEEDRLLARVEVPGVRKEDLEITLERGTLTISGARQPEEMTGYTAHRQERGQVRFTQSFALPVPVNADNVEAKLQDGVLWLTLPKAPEARRRRINLS